MKKLICAAALVFAGASFGVQCQWGFSGVETSDKASTTYNYVTYLCNNAVVSQSDMVTALSSGDLSKLSTANLIQATANTTQQGSNQKVRLGTQTVGTADTYTAGTDYTFYTIILNNSVAGSATEFLATDAKTVQAPGVGYLSFTLGNLAKTSDDWVAIPEPTSGLLLLLGMAGLALKRKRA